METTPIKKKPRKRIAVYIDPDTHETLRYHRWRSGRSVGEIIDDLVIDRLALPETATTPSQSA